MRLLKRKKGNKTYFYLQHSFRLKNKVITKEIYVGEKIPPNIEEIRQKLRQEIESYKKKEIYENLDKIKKNFKKEWSKYPKSAKEKELEEIAIAFTYNTNAIEGSTITLHEVRSIVKDKISPTKPLYDVKETETHYNVFLEMLRKKENISIELLLKWHLNIFNQTMSDIAGKFRNYLVRIGSYIAPDWQDVKDLMNQLVKFINNSKINPVELAARTHYRFEKIHPFGNGNGRIGRLIMNHTLWHNGYPMFIIEYRRRKAYYKALEKDEEGFMKYFFRTYMRVHKKRIK